MRGIDVSENNGNVDWEAVARAGYEFAIIRLGYGHGHLDSKFYNNINAAKAVGLKLGVYYYSYAVTEDDAEYEADYIAKILDDCGLGANDLPMGVWIDEEDADGWRERHGLDMSPEGLQTITNMVTLTVNKLWDAGLQPAGVYCNLDWLENHIDIACRLPVHLNNRIHWNDNNRSRSLEEQKLDVYVTLDRNCNR